jgi:hypothetical protein
MTPRGRLLVLSALVVVSGACEYLPPRTEEWMIVLGDAVRRREGQSWADVPPASTQLEPVPTTTVEALCHGDHPAAIEVTIVIRAHFEPDWWGWACTVAWCESRFEADARNGVHRGLFQINHELWGDALPGADLWSLDGNAAVARYVLDAQGRRAWQCDPWG